MFKIFQLMLPEKGIFKCLFQTRVLFNQFLLKVLKETQYSRVKGNASFPFYKLSSKPNPMCLCCTTTPAPSNALGHAAGTKWEGPTPGAQSQGRVTSLRSSQGPGMDAQRNVRTGQVHLMAPQGFYRGCFECDVMC